MVQLVTMSKSDLLVGFEGGGTKTTCLVVGHDGSIKGIGTGGPSNILVVGKDKTRGSLSDAIKEATSGKGLGGTVSAVCVGAAGSGNPEGKKLMQEVSHYVSWVQLLLGHTVLRLNPMNIVQAGCFLILILQLIQMTRERLKKCFPISAMK